MAADNEPRKRAPRVRLPNVMIGSGGKHILPWGSSGYDKNWVPAVGEDTRDLRDAEELGREILDARDH